jgi:hypothetical protein
VGSSKRSFLQMSWYKFPPKLEQIKALVGLQLWVQISSKFFKTVFVSYEYEKRSQWVGVFFYQYRGIITCFPAN